MKNKKSSLPELSKKLQAWYVENRRELPWRANRDPYRIWISEIMLQQTTVQAVIPFYDRFMLKFPNLQKLANAPLPDVLESWAGLGYYSRARNLHKAAQQLSQEKNFPRSAAELIEFPGFGPYTSRAVSSLAFSEKVGVLDGNVIRVLSRVFAFQTDWWNSKDRQTLQKISDELAQVGEPSILNQALMELGATVCTPKSPACMMCPWVQSCEARKQDLIAKIPRPKPRRDFETWVWQVDLMEKNSKFAVIENNYAPFLKGQLIFPGKIQKQKQKPKAFDLRHGITHHEIYIQVNKTVGKGSFQWVTAQELKRLNPSSLLQKVISKFSS